jgi:hypothetical protein
MSLGGGAEPTDASGAMVVAPGCDDDEFCEHWRCAFESALRAPPPLNRFDRNNPEHRPFLRRRAEQIDRAEELPRDWPRDVPAAVWYCDAPGGRTVRLVDAVCEALLGEQHALLGLNDAEGTVRSHATFSCEDVTLTIGSNYRSETGLRAPGEVDGAQPASALPANVVHALFEDTAFPKIDCTRCARPAETATRYLSVHSWPHGEWYIMRDENDTLHLWQLTGEPRRPDEVPTIFGASPLN